MVCGGCLQAPSLPRYSSMGLFNGLKNTGLVTRPALPGWDPSPWDAEGGLSHCMVFPSHVTIKRWCQQICLETSALMSCSLESLKDIGDTHGEEEGLTKTLAFIHIHGYTTAVLHCLDCPLKGPSGSRDVITTDRINIH